jgi:hypothetical protein
VVQGGQVYVGTLACPEPRPAQLFKGQLDAVIERELLLLSDVHQLVRRHGPAIWPGWKNCDSAEFRLYFPDGQQVLVTNNRDVQSPFERTSQTKIGGKTVYLDRSAVHGQGLAPLGGMRGETSTSGTIQAWFTASGSDSREDFDESDVQPV